MVIESYRANFGNVCAITKGRGFLFHFAGYGKVMWIVYFVGCGFILRESMYISLFGVLPNLFLFPVSQGVQ
jgi:hypothetical protein